jgi:hypothetical protein
MLKTVTNHGFNGGFYKRGAQCQLITAYGLAVELYAPAKINKVGRNAKTGGIAVGPGDVDEF